MYVCMYVYVCMCVCVFVCLLMKGSVSFDPNNAKFTKKKKKKKKKINECMGRVIIQLKTVQDWLKNPCKCARSLSNCKQNA